MRNDDAKELILGCFRSSTYHANHYTLVWQELGTRRSHEEKIYFQHKRGKRSNAVLGSLKCLGIPEIFLAAFLFFFKFCTLYPTEQHWFVSILWTIVQHR